MKYLMVLMLSVCSFASTPIDTLALERSDSGNKYVKIHTQPPYDLYSSYGVPWNNSVPWGTMVDNRDGQVYRTVTIGSQTWMAQNLNYAPNSIPGQKIPRCYLGTLLNCAVCGAQYAWTTAMNIDSTDTARFVDTVKNRGICPEGWHIPTVTEYRTLMANTGNDSATAGVRLKAKRGWRSLPTGSQFKNGTDEYGFRLLGCGLVNTTPGAAYRYNSMEFVSYIHLASQSSARSPYYMYAGYSYDHFALDTVDSKQTRMFPVRCVKD
jgi:uncharacterized protein (TIGR02145 family)